MQETYQNERQSQQVSFTSKTLNRAGPVRSDQELSAADPEGLRDVVGVTELD